MKDLKSGSELMEKNTYLERMSVCGCWRILMTNRLKKGGVVSPMIRILSQSLETVFLINSESDSW